MEKVELNKLHQKIIKLAKKEYFPEEIVSKLNIEYSFVMSVLYKYKMKTNFRKERKEKLIKYCLQKVEELAKQLKGIPLRLEMYEYLNVKDTHLICICEKHLEKLGFQYLNTNRFHPKYTDDFLINHLKELSIQLGRTPSKLDIKKAGKVSTRPYFSRFGSLCNAQKAIGLIPNKNTYQPKFNNDYLLNHLKELSVKLGKTPAASDIMDAGKVSATTYVNYFGSICNAQEEAGLVPSKRGTQQKYSDDFLLNHMKELSLQLGRTPSEKDIILFGKVSKSVYQGNFGSMCKAQQAAGLVPNKAYKKQIYSDDYLLNHLRELSKQLGRTPYCRDITELGKVSVTIYVKRFGGIIKAQQAAGLVPTKRGNYKSQRRGQSSDELI